MNQPTLPWPPELFALDPAVLWVMHCSEGLIPRAAAEQAGAMLQRELQPWRSPWNEDFVGIPARVRRLGAELLGVDQTDLSLVASTGDGLRTVAQGIDWQPGDEVLLPLGEFPTNYWPWAALRARGVVLREVPLWDGHRAGATTLESTPPPVDVEPEQRLIAALGARTRMVAASWVRFQDGLVLDLARLGATLRERGVTLVVDGVQGMGTLRPDLRFVDALACGGHKGLLAPQGLGVLFTRPELRATLAPPGGWLAVTAATDFSRPNTDFSRQFRSDGSALEVGVPNLVGGAALGESLDLLARTGVDALAGYIERLHRMLLAGLSEGRVWRAEATRLNQLRDRSRLGSITALHHRELGIDRLLRLLRLGSAAGVLASVREGYLRVALHGWHTEQDVTRLLAWLHSED